MIASRRFAPARLVKRRDRIALILALFQTADLVVTTTSSSYGDEHLEHLGVPRGLRPALPVVKLAAVVGLMATSRRPAARSWVGAGLAAYYAAAASFHVRAGDEPADVAPAIACGVLAATLV